MNTLPLPKAPWSIRFALETIFIYLIVTIIMTVVGSVSLDLDEHALATWWYMVTYIGAVVVTLGIITYRLLTTRKSWRDIGMRKTPFWPAVKLVAYYPIAVLALLFAVVVISVIYFSFIGGDPPESPETATRTLNFYTIAITIIVAPFIEEVLFRGLLLSSLAQHMRIRYAVIIASIIFALVHASVFLDGNIIGIIGLFLGSLYLCYMFVRTSSILPGIAVHMLHNFIVGVVFVIFA